MNEKDTLLKRVVAESGGEIRYVALISGDRIVAEAQAKTEEKPIKDAMSLVKLIEEGPLKGLQDRVDVRLRDGEHIIIEWAEPFRILCITRTSPNLGKLYIILDRLRKEVLKDWKPASS